MGNHLVGHRAERMYLTPINWHLAAEEVEYILENSEARVLVTGEATADVAARASASGRTS